jgi:hypothetical protein
MKKFLTMLIVAVVAAAAFCVGYFRVDYTNTHSKYWKSIGKSEFSMTIPKTMKEESGYTTSTGTESLAVYSNTGAAITVCKLPFSTNEDLKDVNLKDYINSRKINGTQLVAKKINDGYYAVYTQGDYSNEATADQTFAVDGYYIGDSAIYEVKICCATADRADYEASMMKWLDSFELK